MDYSATYGQGDDHAELYQRKRHGLVGGYACSCQQAYIDGFAQANAVDSDGDEIHQAYHGHDQHGHMERQGDAQRLGVGVDEEDVDELSQCRDGEGLRKPEAVSLDFLVETAELRQDKDQQPMNDAVSFMGTGGVEVPEASINRAAEQGEIYGNIAGQRGGDPEAAV